MARELIANNFAVRLAQGCNQLDTTIVVTSAAPTWLQGGQFRVLIDQEYMIVTGGQDTVVWNVSRGSGTGENPTPTQVGHGQGSWVTHLLTAGAITKLIADAVSGVTPVGATYRDLPASGLTLSGGLADTFKAPFRDKPTGALIAGARIVDSFVGLHSFRDSPSGLLIPAGRIAERFTSTAKLSPAKAIILGGFNTDAFTGFPSTPVLDNFNRTAENPLAGGWISTGGPNNTTPLQTNGTQALSALSTGNFVGSSWATQFTLPIQIYVDLPAGTGNDATLLFITPASGGATAFYQMHAFPTSWTIDDGTTQYAAGTTTFHAGDSIGMSISAAGVITAYQKTGGAWTSLGSGTVTPAFTSGYLAILTEDASVLFDNFGGGGVPGPPGPLTPPVIT